MAETPPAPSRPEAPPALKKQLASGMPFASLEHIFILTTGEGPDVSRSATTLGMLKDVVGEEPEIIRQKVPRDLVARCDFLEKLRGGGSLPDAAWRALANLKPHMVKEAREGAYRVCVRTFTLETGDIATMLLFYSKDKSPSTEPELTN